MIFLAVVTAFLGACAANSMKPPKEIETCDLDGKKELRVKVTYGDGHLDVNYFTQASKKEYRRIVFELDGKPSQAPPKGSGVNYDNLVITIRGKTDTDADVIDIEASANQEDRYKTVCISNKDERSYRYLIYVPGVGTIDPIIDIIP